jgi:tetratricopeptide (TPR) repeat protein
MNLSRQRLFFAVTIALPLFLFLFVEGGLRISGYGGDLSLFKTETVNGTDYHIMNPAVKSRYFSKVDFFPSTSPDHFLVPKPAGTFRIFCLGASTTVGFPYWYNAAFPTFLRDRLVCTFPGRRIEVINLGMTATNSITALDMAEDIMDQEPDLVLVYDGHNEFYGALGVASHESIAGPSWMNRVSLKLIHLRTFLAMRDAYALLTRLFSGDEEASRGTMMERLAHGRYIPLDSDLYREGLNVFRTHLNSIRDICERHHVPVIFGTQVSNLRGQPPFISADPTLLPVAEQMRFHGAFNDGLTAMMDQDHARALASLREAASIFPAHAEARFRIAVCLDSLGQKAEAAQSYREARDRDELRFRTSSDFNMAILAMEDSELSAAVDIEQAFAERSRDRIIGYDLIFEHLHPVAYGQFIIARAFASAMRRRGILASPAAWIQQDTVADGRLWQDRRVTELDERIAGRRTEVLVTAWPFQQGESPISAIPAQDTVGMLADSVVRGELQWRQAHEHAAHLCRERGDMSGLVSEYRTILSQFPLTENAACLRVARYLKDRGNTDDAGRLLRTILSSDPGNSAAAAMLNEVNGFLEALPQR